MKILSAAQIREVDAFTIENEPISSIGLMERAAEACVTRITEITGHDARYLIFCGKGNNGGDGLAIARLLTDMRRKAEVFVVEHADNASADHTENLTRLEKQGLVKIHFIKNKPDIKSEENTFIIDALLGTGLNKVVEGILADCIESVNNSGLPVLAIDIPSGLFADQKTLHKHIIRAQRTLTFQRPKLSFLLSDHVQYVGDMEVLDIGLDEQFIESQTSDHHLLLAKDVSPMLVPRKKFDHKGSFGYALLLAGSKGKTGAAVLAARACLRSGAGLLTAHLPASSLPIMQTALPEAMVSTDAEPDYISSLPQGNFSAIGMGPGIGTEKETAQALKLLIQNAPAPMVLDADAINILSENKTWIAFLPPFTILTPHPREFDRLCGAHTSGFDRLQTARAFAQKNNVIVVLKGAYTSVCMPDKKVFFNSTGNPALAKGGTGDVLTGIILGLLAQDYPPEKAALIAVFVHGHAADLYIEKNSMQTMLASDLVELLPQAFLL